MRAMSPWWSAAQPQVEAAGKFGEQEVEVRLQVSLGEVLPHLAAIAIPLAGPPGNRAAGTAVSCR